MNRKRGPDMSEFMFEWIAFPSFLVFTLWLIPIVIDSDFFEERINPSVFALFDKIETFLKDRK